MANTAGLSISTVATVAIPVRDVDGAIAFYTETLGLEKRRDATFGPGFRWVEVAPAGSATTIALAPPAPEEEEARGSDTGIRLRTDNVAAAHERLRASGAEVDQEVMNLPGVPPMFSFRDPEGNRLYMVQEA